ncbi:hypothetical protein T265_08915 [Opisthorchis viverrini]|uniref:Uncharacterized protein n=1 Tax=Opisthorchis viverrini TaxID=6198 RepID=A0A074Z7V3_OPIVI|nr:hypothetical protein T265_08915 [Opisthorchis viverrini]KER23148.1 hypothetical protein T265_08915 [Opisthorchis viverrini]
MGSSGVKGHSKHLAITGTEFEKSDVARFSSASECVQETLTSKHESSRALRSAGKVRRSRNKPEEDRRENLAGSPAVNYVPKCARSEVSYKSRKTFVTTLNKIYDTEIGVAQSTEFTLSSLIESPGSEIKERASDYRRTLSSR